MTVIGTRIARVSMNLLSIVFAESGMIENGDFTFSGLDVVVIFFFLNI